MLGNKTLLNGRVYRENGGISGRPFDGGLASNQTGRERTQWYFQRYTAHLPASVPHTDATPPPIALPHRPRASHAYIRPPRSDQNYVPEVEW